MTLKATGSYKVPLAKSVSDIAVEIEQAVKDQINSHLSKEVDEGGNRVQIIGEPDVVDYDFKVRPFRDWEYIEEWKGTARVRFHGKFTASSIAVMVLAIVYKLGPMILAGIILIIVLDKIVKIAEVIRDITTDYVKTTEYLLDEEGNLVLDDKGKPIIIRTYEERTSTIGEWMPWLFNIVLVIAIAIVAVMVLPMFRKGGRRR